MVRTKGAKSLEIFMSQEYKCSNTAIEGVRSKKTVCFLTTRRKLVQKNDEHLLLHPFNAKHLHSSMSREEQMHTFRKFPASIETLTSVYQTVPFDLWKHLGTKA